MDTHTLMGSIVVAASAQMELEIKHEEVTDSVAEHLAAGKDLGGRRPTFSSSQIRAGVGLAGTQESATQVARDLGMTWANLKRRSRQFT